MFKNEEVKGTFNILPTKEKATPDSVTRGVFGIGVEQLIKDIRTNAGGKYDSIYIKQAVR